MSMGSEGARVGHAPDSGDAGDERPVQPAAPSGTSSAAMTARDVAYRKAGIDHAAA